MNDASASPTLDAPQNSGALQKKFLLLVVFALATHTALIVLFGTKKEIVPRPASNVPQLQLAEAGDELLELDNPALFALPNARDFSAAVWQKNPAVPLPSFRYHEEPRWLPLAPENLGAAFAQFLQTNRFGSFTPDLKPAPMFATPAAVFMSDLPQNSTLQISGALARRKLVSSPALPALELNDILAPSKVKVLVDPTGNVSSAVLLPLENPLETAGHSAAGDTNAVAIALGLKFLPAPQPTFGEIIFHWHTVPINSTNPP